ALLGFEGKGLTISTRDGKVYVSMEDKLLFRSGSYEIGRDGEKAVRDLAKVLAANPDINVMVEGHTDDVRYTPNAYLKDNLDLSAKRATTVVRLLLENKEIAPERIVAAGRGESLPVAEGKTAEARAKNRRTEIILTPKYDELMKLMETTNNE
ncbi:MAG: OmpA family protein, partial [Rikenellaceae bacterium]|nr:OmpA family protein [Rikenellaceae bacterium]